jgi:hypothetical protein
LLLKKPVFVVEGNSVTEEADLERKERQAARSKTSLPVVLLLAF